MEGEPVQCMMLYSSNKDGHINLFATQSKGTDVATAVIDMSNIISI